mgnify:CR=1 FL=1
MREILFRGKRKDNGEWVYGSLIQRKVWSSEFYVIRVEDNGFDSYEEYEIIPETVGQFTELCDKNGKKIFEGDFVKCQNYHGEVCGEVAYCESFFYLMCFSGYSDEYLFNCKNFEVIGNVHDNPELSGE